MQALIEYAFFDSVRLTHIISRWKEYVIHIWRWAVRNWRCKPFFQCHNSVNMQRQDLNLRLSKVRVGALNPLHHTAYDIGGNRLEVLGTHRCSKSTFLLLLGIWIPLPGTQPFACVPSRSSEPKWSSCLSQFIFYYRTQPLFHSKYMCGYLYMPGNMSKPDRVLPHSSWGQVEQRNNNQRITQRRIY